MATFTGFCQEASGKGTIWIEYFVTKNNSIHEAKEMAQRLCAEAWGYSKEDVHVLGIAIGDVTIAYWDDIGE